ncbi:TRADD-N-associated membrane domain-containing protein [Crassaminicella profunda]|uniref:TRADD-N-associated membrane domain-containing protein n=1 Tax=Crassaminicella profunda TaxID=1286698 RepID=UPI001CA6091D|nr:hypothetical protein [Crassaminicella profunda]QZY56671.1 hypothetical protein K7H06_07050 [Crassaminicella profunda]
MEQVKEQDIEQGIKISNIKTTNKLLDLEYIESRVIKLQEELDSDINTSRGIRYFFYIVGIFCALGYFKIVYINTYFNYILTFFSIIFIMASFSNSKQNKLKREIEFLNKKKAKSMESTNQEVHPEYFDSLVGINIRNLEEYYELVKKSNKSSFHVSIVMSLIGVGLITGGLVAGYFSEKLQNISYIVSASGILVEIITGLLFYLYNKSVIQLKEYHDSLLDVQNILLSFKLIDDIKEEKHRLDIMKHMIEFLTERRK